MNDICYYPHFGYVLPNGNLCVKTAETAPDGEKLDGIVEVSPDHPKYREWLQAITNKERYFSDLRREQMQAREQRRVAANQKRADNKPPRGN